jgi:hypothetical protein
LRQRLYGCSLHGLGSSPPATFAPSGWVGPVGGFRPEGVKDVLPDHMSRGAFRAGLGLQGGDRAADLAFPGAEAGQCLGCALVIGAEQGEQEVVGADAVIAVRRRLGQHCLDQGARGRGCGAGPACCRPRAVICPAC